MTKSLTDKWRDWELPNGSYYVKDWDGTIDRFVAQKNILWRDSNNPIYTSERIEILEPVPSYKELQKLKEQLKEANEIIANFRTYDFTINDENAEEYQVKYGIAGEKIYTNKKPPKEFERWRKKITKSFEKKLKSGV